MSRIPDWAIMMGILVSSILFVVSMALLVVPSEAQQAETTARYQKKAEAWLVAHKIAGVVTCRGYSPGCDVVPSDPRPPFQINCGSDWPCDLVAP